VRSCYGSGDNGGGNDTGGRKKPAQWPIVTIEAVDAKTGRMFAGRIPRARFQFPQPVAPGLLLARVDGLSPGIYLKSVTYGGQDALLRRHWT